jgi:hypothetical protein
MSRRVCHADWWFVIIHIIAWFKKESFAYNIQYGGDDVTYAPIIQQNSVIFVTLFERMTSQLERII